MIGYTTEAQKQADIRRKEAELAKAKAAPVEPDLSEAVTAFSRAYYANGKGPLFTQGTIDGLIAAYPHLHKALGNAPAVPWPGDDEKYAMVDAAVRCGAPEDIALEMARRIHEWQQANVAPVPSDANDRAMARKICHICEASSRENLALAAMLAERRRARGGAK